MPVFISYSHENKEFVDQFAMQLVRQNVHIWLDNLKFIPPFGTFLFLKCLPRVSSGFDIPWIKINERILLTFFLTRLTDKEVCLF